MTTCTHCKKQIKETDHRMCWAVRFNDYVDRFHVDGDGGFDISYGRSRGVFHKKCYDKILKYAGVKK